MKGTEGEVVNGGNQKANRRLENVLVASKKEHLSHRRGRALLRPQSHLQNQFARLHLPPT